MLQSKIAADGNQHFTFQPVTKLCQHSFHLCK